MTKGFKDSKGKFRPTENKNGVRKSRDQTSKTQGVKLNSDIRMKRDLLPTQLSGFDNIELIRDEDTRNNVIDILLDLQRKFVENRMDNGMIWGFLKDCVNGQILISLGKNDKSHYTNKLNDFYIDDRVGFKGIRDVMRLRGELETELKKIVKYEKPKFVEGDIVKPDKLTSNVALKDFGNMDKTFKIVEMTRGLDPSYVGYQIVDVTQPYKKNWIYAGSDDLIKGGV